jgi:hypothetical protein
MFKYVVHLVVIVPYRIKEGFELHCVYRIEWQGECWCETVEV